MNGSIDTATVSVIVILSAALVELTKTVISKLKRNGNGNGTYLAKEEHDLLLGIIYTQKAMSESLTRIEARLH